MIKAIAFDLDGTLVETEFLKAISYARATQELCPQCITEEEVLEAYKDVVGRSRQEVAQTLMQRFGLEEKSTQRMAELGVDQPWQAFVQVRLRIFEQMMQDPELIREHRRPDVIALLDHVRRTGMRTCLTTTSSRAATIRVLDALGLTDKFEFIATADEVDRTKPDPEVYLLVSCILEVPPKQFVVIEDSLPGVQAAWAAGMWCVAVPTPFTHESIREARLLDDQWIVEDTAELSAVAKRMIAEREHD